MTKDCTQTSVTPATDADIADMEQALSSYHPRDITWAPTDVPSLIARIRASEPVWQDIATAPRDGTEIDIWAVSFAEATRWADVHFDNGCWWNVDGRLSEKYWTFTHWMPLPSPPKPLSYEGEQS